MPIIAHLGEPGGRNYKATSRVQTWPIEIVTLDINGGDATTQARFEFKLKDLGTLPPIDVVFQFQITDADHAALEQLVRQPNKLLALLKSILLREPGSGFLMRYIDWLFKVFRTAILTEILRQLRLPPQPPPRCCS